MRVNCLVVSRWYCYNLKLRKIEIVLKKINKIECEIAKVNKKRYCQTTVNEVFKTIDKQKEIHLNLKNVENNQK